MKTITVNSELEFSQLFNCKFQPRNIKSVNGINVNVFNAPLIDNELSVTRKHVMIENYSIPEQSTNYTFLRAPFILTF